MKGLILSGGAGTRLRPITHTSAKQLVPIANKPILFYGIEAMARAGIREIGIIVGSTGDEIRAAVGDGARFGVAVTRVTRADLEMTAVPGLRLQFGDQVQIVGGGVSAGEDDAVRRDTPLRGYPTLRPREGCAWHRPVPSAEVRTGAEKQAAALIDKAREEAAAIVAAARKAAEDEAVLAAQKARDQLREQVAQLAVAGAERILRSEINAARHADLLANLKNELR